MSLIFPGVIPPHIEDLEMAMKLSIVGTAFIVFLSVWTLLDSAPGNRIFF